MGEDFILVAHPFGAELFHRPPDPLAEMRIRQREHTPLRKVNGFPGHAATESRFRRR
ncbi:MAG: hypothetical protein OHK0029_27500 [Armatimonadaceae bacterium]